MNVSHGETTSFGPFRLSPTKRAIERDGVPLALGDRALDLLITLVEHPGEIVSHRALSWEQRSAATLASSASLASKSPQTSSRSA
jgi:DNA-binding winged helix-turn-helix (wHTH) protein